MYVLSQASVTQLSQELSRVELIISIDPLTEDPLSLSGSHSVENLHAIDDLSESASDRISFGRDVPQS